jgi:hypothetical protein
MMSEIEKQSDSEIQKLRKHFDEIIARLTEIKTRHEKTLTDHRIERSEQVNRLKTQYGELKKDVVETTQLLEENNSTMSDYNLIDNHRELLKLLSVGEEEEEVRSEYSLRYTRGEFDDSNLDSLMGQTLDLEDIGATETNSFQYSDKPVYILNVFSENEGYAQAVESEYIEHITKQGDKKQKYKVAVNGVCVTGSGDIYITDGENKAVVCLSPSGSVSTVVSTRPLIPAGICQSLDGGLLVTLGEMKLKTYLLRHMTLTGDVICDYEYQEDGQTRLFTVPFRVKQNGNSDICVVNRTSDDTGNMMILSLAGCLKSVYHGQNLKEDFAPYDVSCDSRCNILVTEPTNNRVHLLSPDGEFLKILLTEDEVRFPCSLSLYGSTLWVGCADGTVKLFQLCLNRH